MFIRKNGKLFHLTKCLNRHIQLNKAMSFKKEVQKNIYLFATGIVILLLATIAVYMPSITGFYTASVSEYEQGSYKGSLTLLFNNEYANVNKIAFEGTPGGIWCKANIKIEAYDSSGTKVGEWTSNRVSDNEKAWKEVDINPSLNIKKIVGKPSGDFPSCVFIDYLKATMTYNVPEEGETTGLEGTSVVSNESSQTYTDTVTFNFGKEYNNVKRITIKGRPGGAWCQAKVKADAFDKNENKVATITTDSVESQNEVTKYADFENPIKVKWITGETDSGCSYIDYMKATLNYIEEQQAPVQETVTATTPDITKPEISSLTITPSSPITADDIKISATATDNVGVTKIEIYISDVLVKTCLDTNSCSTDAINYPNTCSHYYYARAYDAAGNEVKTETKRFNVRSVPTYALSVTVSGDGDGRVNSTPVDINCTYSCKKRFEEGKQLILTAIPDSGSKFKEWSGDCSGTNPKCTLTINSGKTVKATFEELPTSGVTFTMSPTTGAAPLDVTFTPTVSGSSAIKEYEWVFGDGETYAVTVNPKLTARSHRYTSGGTYNVELTITNEFDKKSSETKTLTVGAQSPTATDNTPPTVILTVPRTTAEVGDEIYISATANDNVALKSVKLFAHGSNYDNGEHPDGMVKECTASGTSTKQLTCSYSIYYTSTGSYSISAEAQDLSTQYGSYYPGLTGTANPISININPDTKPPYIQSTLTEGESTKKGTYYSVDATATDGTCVAKIEIGGKEKLVKTCDFSSSCGRVESCSTGLFNPANFGRIIYVKAYDPLGHVATENVKDNGKFESLLDETNANSNPPPSEDAKKGKLLR